MSANTRFLCSWRRMEILTGECRACRLTALVLAIVILFLPSLTHGEEPEYLVGFGRKKITPTESVWMSGYSGRHQGSQGVLDDLYVQAMAIRDRNGNRALLLRVDVCVLRDPTVTQICELIRQRTGLLRREILVNVSHTHSGPAVDELYHYDMSTAHRVTLAAYMEQLKSDCADAAVEAIENLMPAELEFGVGEADFIHNRRGLDERGRYTGMRPNPNNHTDLNVPVLRITDADGDVRGVVFGVACHNVTLGPNYQLSGDYAGHARMQLEKEIPHALFVTGCGGDANPNVEGNTIESVQQHGITLAAEVKRVMGESMQPVCGPLQTAFRYVDLPLVSFSSRIEIEQMRAGPYADYGNVNKLLDILDRGAALPTVFPAPFTVWQFGSDLSLIGLPEETVSEYVPLVKETLGSRSLWVAGYCNDVSGYLPTANIMRQGGYETRGMIADTKAGWFSPEVESTLVNAVREMVLEAEQAVSAASIPTPIETYAQWRFEEDMPFSGLEGRGNVERVEHGIRFDGESYLEGPPVQLTEANEKGLTIAAWIKPEEDCMSGTRMIVCEWANTVKGDRLSLSLNNGRPGVGIADGDTGEQGFASNQIVSPGRWTFVAATWEPATRRYRIYVDGRLASTTGIQTGSGIRPAGTTTFKIGAQASEAHPRMYMGVIDDVWIGNALNPAGIVELYERQADRP